MPSFKTSQPIKAAKKHGCLAQNRRLAHFVQPGCQHDRPKAEIGDNAPRQPARSERAKCRAHVHPPPVKGCKCPHSQQPVDHEIPCQKGERVGGCANAVSVPSRIKRHDHPGEYRARQGWPHGRAVHLHVTQIIERKAKYSGHQHENPQPLERAKDLAENQIGPDDRKKRPCAAHYRINNRVGAPVIGPTLGDFVGDVDDPGDGENGPQMRLGPGHHKQRKGCGDNTVAEINHAAA